MARLNKAGLPMTRNLAKPWKNPRWDSKNDQPHWQDNMRLGVQGQHVNSTGCVGMLGGSVMVRVKKFGPTKGKSRNPKPKKRCKLISSDQIKRSDHHAVKKCVEIRNEIARFRVAEEFLNKKLLPGSVNKGYEKLTVFIKQRVNSSEWGEIEKERKLGEDSIWGTYEAVGVRRLDVKDLARRVNFLVAKL